MVERLPFRTKAFYGLAGITMNLPDLILMQWLLVRYVSPDKPHLLPAAVFGGIILLSRVFEASIGTVIAHWSDTCRSRWGRRLPFMRFGILPFATVFFLLFHPPIGYQHWLNAAYAIVLLPSYFMLYGAVVTPYLALLPEITSNLKERVDLTTFQSVFILMGTFLFAGTGILLDLWGWTIVMGGASLLIVACFIPVSFFVKEKPHPETDAQPLSLLQSLWLALKNRPCRHVLAATSVYWFALNAVIALVPYWVVNFLGRSEADVTKLMALFLLVNLAFFFVFNALAARVGKYALLLATFLGTSAVLVLLCLVGHFPFGSDFAQSVVVMALFGAPVAGFMVLPFAVLADVIDYDETLTGRRREGIFLGVQGVFQKLMLGVSVLTFTIVPYLGGDGTQRLREDGWLTFSGRYEALPGTTLPEPLQGSEAPAEGNQVRCVRIEPLPRGLDAPWTLAAPDGSRHSGHGVAVLENLAPGPYAMEWHNLNGWVRPDPQQPPTPRGLKIMVALCAAACLISFAAFLRYPLRERSGSVVLVAN